MNRQTQKNRGRISRESVLRKALRHVLEAEQRVADQEARVERLRNGGLEVSTAEFQLKVFKQTLATMRDHLAFEQQEAQRKRN